MFFKILTMHRCFNTVFCGLSEFTLVLEYLLQTARCHAHKST